MFENITYYMIFGKPLIMYTGIITLLSFITTATMGYLLHRGKVPFKWHLRMVITSFTLLAIHAFLGIMIYF